MPCYDCGPTQEQIEHPRKVEALLCAIFGVLNSRNGPAHLFDVLNAVNWTNAGVSREWASLWWQNHQEEDRQRAIRENEEAQRIRARQAALDKLTPQERAALGIR